MIPTKNYEINLNAPDWLMEVFGGKLPDIVYRGDILPFTAQHGKEKLGLFIEEVPGSAETLGKLISMKFRLMCFRHEVEGKKSVIVYPVAVGPAPLVILAELD